MGMFMPADQIDVQGEVEGWTRTSDQGNQNTRFACSECGNVIYGVSDHKPDVYKFQPGLLDDTSEVEPDIHIWVEQAQKWVLFPEGAPQFKGQPDPADSLKAGLEYQKSRR
jgi:hypothetical protein